MYMGKYVSKNMHSDQKIYLLQYNAIILLVGIN